jgi:hypothetical protein
MQIDIPLDGALEINSVISTRMKQLDILCEMPSVAEDVKEVYDAKRKKLESVRKIFEKAMKKL